MFKFHRFVHFEVLVIDKYRYGDNIFPRDVKYCPRTGYISCGFLWPGLDPHTNFSPYENWLKTNVDTLLPDFPYGDKILRCGDKYSRHNGTCQ
jgi:hypothetical protein